MSRRDNQAAIAAWFDTLEHRYLGDLRIGEVSRALRALSSAYVERRHKGARPHVSGALDTVGKRTAFALYYAPLHFLAVSEVIRALGAHAPPPRRILDLGCGTGVAGAAWAVQAGGAPVVSGVDRHPWAVAEANWTYRQLRVRGRARRDRIDRLTSVRGATSAIAAYVLNELSDTSRRIVEDRLLELTRGGGRVLIVEPIAQGVAPWWSDTARRFVALGGRADEWRFGVDPPAVVRRLGAAAGLRYRELRLRTLYA
jgi:SAM-dependent methyltransferase